MPSASANKKRLSGPKAERTRTAIKAAVLELLRERPLKDVALDEICGRAGVTQGALYFHFKNKDAAIDETIGDVAARFGDRLLAIEEDADLYRFIYRIVREFLPGLAWFQIMPAFTGARWNSEQLKHQWADIRQQLVDRICQRVHDQADAPAQPRKQTRMIAAFLMSGSEGAWEHLLDQSALKAAPPQKQITAVATAWHRALTGQDPDKRSVAAMTEARMRATKFIVYPQTAGQPQSDRSGG